MKGSFKIGRIVGIDIFIHWTFAILIAYIIYSNYSAGKSFDQIIWAVIFVLSIFLTVFLHELGHALAAKRYNIKTSDITLLPIGGMARLASIPEKPMEELIVAIAGPLVNIALAIITFFIVYVPDIEQMKAQLATGVNGDNFFLNFFVVNVWLAVFNLIPAFPMDGGRIFRAMLAMRMQRHVATELAARFGQFLAIGFVFIGFVSNPFLIFIGLFIILGAQAETENTKVGFILKGHSIKDIVMRNFESLSETDSIREAIKLLLNGQSKDFLVMSNGTPTGSLSRSDIMEAIQKSGEDTEIRSVMNHNLIRVSINDMIDKVYKDMTDSKSSLVIVYDKNIFIGVLDLENILEYIMIHSAIESHNQKI